MNEHDEKVFYKGMALLGLLMSGTNPDVVPYLVNKLTNEITHKEQDDE